MIYLKVRGGLCNRIRAIDSLISLCKQYKKDLSVLWPMDIALNADFESLFEKPVVLDFQLEIFSCPAGYPEAYLPTFKNQIKNFIKARKLDKELRDIANKVSKVPEQNTMSEVFLDSHYNQIISETQGKVSDMDNLFCERLSKITKGLMEGSNDVYLNSCYRLSAVEDNYSLFKPSKSILKEINKTTSKFQNTFGLHIRRSDHEASKKHSTLEKFIFTIDKELSQDPDATFFLSTDDEITKSELIKKYGDKIIYNEINSYDRNSSEAVSDAVLDLYCLSQTKKLFGSHHSSFSQVAAQIGRIQEITVK